jgi:hypothetical protein
VVDTCVVDSEVVDDAAVVETELEDEIVVLFSVVPVVVSSLLELSELKKLLV